MANTTIAIVVNYNAGEWLQRCLTSLNKAAELSNTTEPNTTRLAHTYIVDNRSTDISLDLIQPILETHPEKFTLIENDQNYGFASANNQILRKIINNKLECDFVLLINPDCEINSDVLPELINEFNARSEYGMLGCLVNNEDGSIQATCRRNFPTPKTALFKLLLLDKFDFSKHSRLNIGDEEVNEFVETEALSGAFMLVRKTALIEVGLLDEKYFMHCEDLDWCMRFKQSGWKVGYSPNVSITHAKGVSSKSRPIGVLWTLHKGMARFFNKFYREQYSFTYRVLIKTGIYASFIARASLVGLKNIIFQGKGKTAAIPKRYR